MLSQKTEASTPKRKQYPLCRAIAGILFGLVLIAYYLAAGCIGGFTVSVLWVWLAVGMTITLLGIADLWMWFHPIRPIRIAVAVLRWLIIACAVAFFSVVGAVLSAMHDTCPVHADYLIVPGAKVYGDQPSDALRARIDLAWDYLSRNPDTVAILSGGQGSGENISEAECMRRTLASYGLTEDRMLLEEQSTTTAENMQFSMYCTGIPMRRWASSAVIFICIDPSAWRRNAAGPGCTVSRPHFGGSCFRIILRENFSPSLWTPCGAICKKATAKTLCSKGQFYCVEQLTYLRNCV